MNNDTTNEPHETDDEIERRYLQSLKDADKERNRQVQRGRESSALYNRRRYAQDEEYRRYIKVANAKRDAIEFSLPYNYGVPDWQRCLEYFNYRCAVCGSPVGLWHFLASDHWIAVSDKRPDNPGTVPWNIIPLCHSREIGMARCNNSKHNKDPEQWLIERVGKRKAAKILKRIKAYFASVKQQG